MTDNPHYMTPKEANSKLCLNGMAPRLLERTAK